MKNIKPNEIIAVATFGQWIKLVDEELFLILKSLGSPPDLEKYYRKFSKDVNKYDISMAFIGQKN